MRNRKSMLRLLLVAAVCSMGLNVSAQSWQDTVAKIEKLFARYQPANPGVQLTISRNGKVLYSKAWGMADLEHNTPLSTISPTEAGSVSKQFTAAAILILEQQGKLKLDDDVRKYIPELPDYGSVITLRHMMQHTSGLKDWGAIASVAGWPRSTKTYDNDDALQILAKQTTLNHKPGDEFSYSNSNYNAFAVIVERVSGLSLADFSKKYIFEPAGMTHTEWRANFKKIVPNRAMAYSKNGNEYQTNMPNEYVYGNGGLLTTTEDLVRWNEYYAANKLGNGGLLEKQRTLGKFNNGTPQSYAAGLFYQKFRGIDLWSHDGATASYRANLDYFPTIGLSIAFLQNTSEYDRDTLNIPVEVRRIFLALPPSNTNATTTTAPATFAVSSDKLNNYVGWYRNTRTNAGTSITLKDGILVTNNNSKLSPVAENVFVSGNNTIVFGNNSKTVLFIAGADSTPYVSEPAADITETNIHNYAGTYYSEESESHIVVMEESGKLFFKIKPADKFQLMPMYKDGFNTPFGPMLFKQTDGKIHTMYISVSRARNVRFIKIK